MKSLGNKGFKFQLKDIIDKKITNEERKTRTTQNLANNTFISNKSDGRRLPSARSSSNNPQLGLRGSRNSNNNHKSFGTSFHTAGNDGTGNESALEFKFGDKLQQQFLNTGDSVSENDLQWGEYFAEQNAKQKETLKGKVAQRQK